MAHPKRNKRQKSNNDLLVAGELRTEGGEDIVLPGQVGQFQHRTVGNPNTTAWERRWQPTTEEYPHLRVEYMVTCEHSSGWQVNRAATIVNKGTALSNAAHCESVRDMTTVATAETKKRAVEIVVEIMQAASVLPDHTPPIVDEVAVASFRDLKHGGSGKVEQEDVERLAKSGDEQ